MALALRSVRNNLSFFLSFFRASQQRASAAQPQRQQLAAPVLPQPRWHGRGRCWGQHSCRLAAARWQHATLTLSLVAPPTPPPPPYAVMRAQLREQSVCEVGEEKVRSWEELGDEQQYQALLSDYFWGINAVVVNEFVQEYLFSL
jgi:hypothetical protein